AGGGEGSRLSQRRGVPRGPAAGEEVRARLASVILGAVLAGCASSSTQTRRIDRYRSDYESWPLETRQAVLDGKVELDMTPTMVRVALGEPGEIVQRMVAGRPETVWIYTKAETVAPAAPQPASPSQPTRTAAINGSNAGAGVSLPTVVYRDREIAFFDGLVCRVDRPL
ncbi:MAG: hypothetical protein NTV51_30845, partial [Verrucomicrobia bacterium]|nr:hypothetical protein [Verrucomicrobiota bacterium]